MASLDRAAGPVRPMPSRGRALFCQVDGCGAALLKSQVKPNCIRYRVCPEHLVAPVVMQRGAAMRFCQQCGAFEPLSAFDGSKRSCRVRLGAHNRGRQERRRQAAMRGEAAAAAALMSGGVRTSARCVDYSAMLQDGSASDDAVGARHRRGAAPGTDSTTRFEQRISGSGSTHGQPGMVAATEAAALHPPMAHVHWPAASMAHPLPSPVVTAPAEQVVPAAAASSRDAAASTAPQVARPAPDACAPRLLSLARQFTAQDAASSADQQQPHAEASATQRGQVPRGAASPPVWRSDSMLSALHSSDAMTPASCGPPGALATHPLPHSGQAPLHSLAGPGGPGASAAAPAGGAIAQAFWPHAPACWQEPAALLPAPLPACIRCAACGSSFVQAAARPWIRQAAGWLAPEQLYGIPSVPLPAVSWLPAAQPQLQVTAQPSCGGFPNTVNGTLAPWTQSVHADEPAALGSAAPAPGPAAAVEPASTQPAPACVPMLPERPELLGQQLHGPGELLSWQEVEELVAPEAEATRVRSDIHSDAARSSECADSGGGTIDQQALLQ